MVQPRWSENLDFRNPKVAVNILICRIHQNVWMADWVGFVFVDVGVKRIDIHIVNGFAFLSLCIQAYSIGSTSKEAVSWVEWFDQLKGLEKFLQLQVCFLVFVKRTLPFLYHLIPSLLKLSCFSTGGFMDFVYGTIWMTIMFSLSMLNPFCATDHKH